MKNIRFLLLIIVSVALAVVKVSAQKSPDKYGTDSVSCMMHTSLYREYFKQKNFNDALPHWRWVFNNCPLASQNIYIDGTRIIGFKINETQDQFVRNAYIDTLMMVFEKRIKYFGNVPASRTGMVRGRQGLELGKYRPSDTLKVYSYLRHSVETEGINSDAAVVSGYFIIINDLVVSKRFSVDSLVEAYDILGDLVDLKCELLKNDSTQFNRWNDVKSLLEARFGPYASCREIEKIYSPKFKQSPNDTILLKKIIRHLDKKDCTGSDLFIQAAGNLHKAKPSGQSAYLMGKLNLTKGDLVKAESYFIEAVPTLDDVQKATACFYLAKIYYNQKRFSEARSYAYKSLAINPADGRCYLLIGNMYAASAPSCGGSDEIASLAGYWAAVDKFIKARNVDSSVADEANKNIAVYSAYFPTRERLFFNELKEGSLYTVGCWIGETTAVRASH